MCSIQQTQQGMEEYQYIHKNQSENIEVQHCVCSPLWMRELEDGERRREEVGCAPTQVAEENLKD